MSETREALVIGAGIVGLSTALYLQRAGIKTTVLDALAPAGGASFGNAGLISADTAAPIALPGMLRKVPGWLMDKTGPLVVKPAYFPKAIPWLLRWMKAGRQDEVMRISDAMRALHQGTFECWRELLGSDLFNDLVKPSGQVQVWESHAQTQSAQIEALIRQRHGIEAQPLGQDELRRMFPGISANVVRGLLVPGNGYTVSPYRAVSALADLLRQEGGEIVVERAMKLIPRDGGFMVMTNLANRTTRTLVLATGAWTDRLIEPLGMRLPLEVERGYHATFFDSGVRTSMPVVNKTRAFSFTPMEEGMRAAGTVEFAGIDAAPDEGRAKLLVKHVKAMFPDIRTDQVRYWMGFRPSTPDSLPVLGPAPGYPGLFCAFGHGHFGITGGPPSARLVSQLIAGQTPDLDPALYSPRRFR